VYKTNFKKKTNALITFFVSLGVFALSTITTIILNSLINNIAPVINIFLSFVIFASFILCAMNLPKHFFDCRNKDFLGLEVQAKMLNIETKTSEVNQNGAQNISAKDKNAIKTNSKTNKTNLEPNKKASNKKAINSKEKVNKNKKRTVDVKISKNVKASNQVKQEKDKKITKSKINEDKSKINN
jgi:multidrug efflux pump subunit AcrB